MELSKTQEEILASSASVVFVQSCAASGKALSHGSKVYTLEGPKNIENLTMTDKIFGEDGKLHNILGIFPQGEKKEYKVTFSDGTFVNCCSEHLWTFQTESLRSARSSRWITCSLAEIIEKYPLYKDSRTKNNFGNKASKRKNLFIPMCKPVQFEEQALQIEPYTFGALLGDGSFRRSTFTNEDKDVLEWVDAGLHQIDCSLKFIDRYDYSINTNKKHIFSKILKFYNLWQVKSEDKFIPNEYKYNSVDNRYKLLQGIIDTDGFCAGSSYDLVLKSKRLILDVKEICESLGLTAVYSEKKAVCTNAKNGVKDCGTVYRLRIKTSKNFPKLHRSLKREKQWKPSKVYSHRAVVDISPTGKETEMTCIMIDNPSHLFLTDNFIVTHNTRLLTEKIRQSISRAKKLVAFTFTNMAAAEIRSRLNVENSDVIWIGTIHSYCARCLLRAGITEAGKYLNNENFDGLFDLARSHPGAFPSLDICLLDEAQDSNEDQFNFIFSIIKSAEYFVVYDERQSIYRWNGSRPDLLKYWAYELNASIYSMDENYRNGSDILDFARDIIRKNKMSDLSIPMRGVRGRVIEVPFSIKYLVDEIKSTSNYGDWMVLARTNAEVDDIFDKLTDAGIPCDTFKQGDLSKDELSEKMKADTVKVLTGHSGKGLEARFVAVYDARMWNEEEVCISYVMATRARDRLIWFTKPVVKKKPRKNSMMSWE